MSIVTTTRPLNLGQLDAELATAAGLDTPPGLSVSSEPAPTQADPDRQRSIVVCEHDAVSETLLDDVIDAHVPAEPPPSVESRLQAQVDELMDVAIELLEALS